MSSLKIITLKAKNKKTGYYAHPLIPKFDGSERINNSAGQPGLHSRTPSRQQQTPLNPGSLAAHTGIQLFRGDEEEA